MIRSFSSCTYENLTKEFRIKLIEEIANVWVNISEDDEIILVDLIETTPTADINYILTELQSRKILETIYNGTHNNDGLDNFTRLIYQLSILSKNNPDRIVSSDKIYVWDRSWFDREAVYDVKFNTDNFITITPDDNYLKAHDVPSFTFIPVRYTKETKYLLPLDDNKSQIALVPAIYFKALHSSRIKDISTTSAEISIDALSLCLGLGEIKSATGVMRAIAIADVALTASNIGFNIARDEIKKLEGGNEFMSGWDKFQMLMALATFSTQQVEDEYGLISDFTTKYRNLQKTYREKDAADVLAKAFGNGDEIAGKAQMKKLEQLADDAEDALKNSNAHASDVNNTPDNDEFWENYIQNVGSGIPALFTQEQIDNYVIFATKNKDASKVMLGKYDAGGATSYIQRAGKDHTYFDMGSEKWTEVETLVNNNPDEMWRINRQFIDVQKALNKEFYFSHEPWKAQTHEYLSKEAEYLIELGAKDFQKINDDTWKVIW